MPARTPPIVADFERRYQQQYGFLMPGKALVIEAIAVEAIGRAESAADLMPQFAPRAGPLTPLKTNRVYTDGRFRDAIVFDRDDLRPGDAIAGPAIIRERNATTVIEPGWRATLTPRDHLVVERVEAAQRTHAIGTTADPVLLEVFNNLFMAIAEQMGVTLANTAYSVNIKERLDFSCAIFDADGNLIANAPHMPVHLGSMGESVKTIIDRRAGTMQRGDVFVLNAPYNGGTHLPDVTVIAPVFLAVVIPARRESGADDDAGDDGLRYRPRVLRRVARPSRRHRRHHAGLDAARFEARRRGGRAARQRAAGRRRPLPRSGDARDSRRRAGIRRATSTRTWPTCAPRSRRAPRARRSSRRWSRTSACPSCAPTCSTCRTTPRKRCAACSTC